MNTSQHGEPTCRKHDSRQTQTDVPPNKKPGHYQCRQLKRQKGQAEITQNIPGNKNNGANNSIPASNNNKKTAKITTIITIEIVIEPKESKNCLPTLRHVGKQTTPQKNATLEPMQPIDRLAETEDRKHRIRSSGPTKRQPKEFERQCSSCSPKYKLEIPRLHSGDAGSLACRFSFKFERHSAFSSFSYLSKHFAFIAFLAKQRASRKLLPAELQLVLGFSTLWSRQLQQKIQCFPALPYGYYLALEWLLDLISLLTLSNFWHHFFSVIHVCC